MAYCSEYRNRILSDHRRHLIVVIASEIKFGTTAPQNKHCVILLPGIHDGIQCRNNGAGAVFSLHQSREKIKFNFESIRVFCNMTHEIAITSCIFSRNNGKSVWKIRKWKLLLKVHKALLLKPFNGLLTLHLLQT